MSTLIKFISDHTYVCLHGEDGVNLVFFKINAAEAKRPRKQAKRAKA